MQRAQQDTIKDTTAVINCVKLTNACSCAILQLCMLGIRKKGRGAAIQICIVTH